MLQRQQYISQQPQCPHSQLCLVCHEMECDFSLSLGPSESGTLGVQSNVNMICIIKEILKGLCWLWMNFVCLICNGEKG